MAQIFISYSRRDLQFVERLAEDLKKAGFEVWYDLSGLEGGTRWSTEIERAIRSSQYVLVVLSPDSVSSEWVEREYLLAGNLKRPIVPLYYLPCELPLGYLNLHYIDVQGGNYERNFAQILNALDDKPASRRTYSQPPAAPSTAHEVKRQKGGTVPMVLIAGLILVGALTGGYLLVDRIRDQNTPTATLPLVATQEPVTTEPPTEPPTEEVPSTDIVDDFGVPMAFIPAGEFTMGSDAGDDDERPAHTVSLPSFYIDKYEVTNRLYKACADAGACAPPQNLTSSTRTNYFGNPEFDDYPVIHVNWDHAKAYCSWRGALLPSEAQWEKAARGTTGHIYPWGDEIDGNFANYDGAFRRDTSRVGSYELGKSMYGVYDMVGNVWEWVSSLYMPYPYRVDERENPNTPGERVVRGGAWYDHTAGLRSSDRYGDPTGDANDGLGFRCTREAYP